MCICQMNCMHRKSYNKRAGVSAPLCVPKRQRKNIIWKFLWHKALQAAADPIPTPYMGLLTQEHIREWLRTGEAMTKVNIDSLFPWHGCLCRKHRSVVQPERRLNELMEERTLSELPNTQKISLGRDVPGLQVLCSGEERLLAILRSHAPRSNISFWALALAVLISLCFYLLLAGEEDWKLPRVLAAATERPLFPQGWLQYRLDGHWVSVFHIQKKFSRVPKWLETAGSVGQDQVTCSGNCFQLAFSLFVSLPVLVHFQLCRNVSFSSTSLYVSRQGTASFKTAEYLEILSLQPFCLW